MFPSDDHATGVKIHTYNLASTYFSRLFYSFLPSIPVRISVSLTYVRVLCACVHTHTDVHKHTQMYTNKMFPKHTSQLLCLLLFPQVPCLPHYNSTYFSGANLFCHSFCLSSSPTSPPGSHLLNTKKTSKYC